MSLTWPHEEHTDICQVKEPHPDGHDIPLSDVLARPGVKWFLGSLHIHIILLSHVQLWGH